MPNTDASNVECRFGDPADLTHWDEARGESTHRSFFNSALLIGALNRHLLPVSVVECWRAGKLIGGCWGWKRSEKGIHRIQTPPSVGHGTIWIRDGGLKPAKAQSLYRDVGEALAPWLAQQFDTIQLCAAPEYANLQAFSGHGWNIIPKETHRLTLLKPDILWDSIDGQARRQIQKAERQGITVELSDDIKALEETARALESRRGINYPPLQGFLGEVMSSIRERDNGRLLIARDPAGDAAASLLFTWEGELAYLFLGAVTEKHAPTGANSLITWEAIKWLAEHQSVKQLDLYGSMPTDVGQFKKRFNGEMVAAHDLTFISNPRLRLRKSVKESLAAMKKILKGSRFGTH